MAVIAIMMALKNNPNKKAITTIKTPTHKTHKTPITAKKTLMKF